MSDVAERTEPILPGPAEALSGLLGVPMPDSGDGLPLLWHWVYLLDRPAQADLGRDGHPVRNTVLAPPEPGRRRMWAGGQVRTPGVLRFGEPATRRTKVLAVQEKTGNSGPLTFVTVGHRIEQAGRLVVEERQDIVYREAVDAAAEPAAPTPDRPAEVPAAEDEWHIDTTPTLLFRYSALTYNGHRIHYDRDYARDVEGYPGLVVHGPLQAITMAEAARRIGHGGRLEFEYRLRAPLFDQQGMVVGVTADDCETRTAVRDLSGRHTATGTLRVID